MRNEATLTAETCMTFHAKFAIEKIQQKVQHFYPRLSRRKKRRLILECLIEIMEEKKFLQSQ